MKPVLLLSDLLVNVLQDARIRTNRGKMMPGLLNAEPLERMDEELYEFLSFHKRLGFSLRDPAAFSWIQEYPWIREDDQRDSRYYFSSNAKPFENTFLKVFDDKGNTESFLMLTRVGNKLTIPYACLPGKEYGRTVKILDQILALKGISYLTLYNPETVGLMQHSSMPCLGRRRMVRKYFVTRELKKRLPESSGIFFQDGDGDAVFT